MKEDDSRNKLAHIITKVEPLYSSSHQDKQVASHQTTAVKVDLATVTKMFNEFIKTASAEEVEKFSRVVLGNVSEKHLRNSK